MAGPSLVATPVDLAVAGITLRAGVIQYLATKARRYVSMATCLETAPRTLERSTGEK